MPEIFFSYAHEDSERIRPLVSALEGQGWDVFWDRRIPAGKTWRSFIGKALIEAKCLIVVWSKNSVNSSWVIEEADEAKSRGLLVPVLLDAIEPPRGFREIQAADLTDWQPGQPSLAFDHFIGDVRSLLGSPAPAAAPGPAPTPVAAGSEAAAPSPGFDRPADDGKKPPRPVPPLAIAAGLGVTALIVIALVWWQFSPTSKVPIPTAPVAGPVDNKIAPAAPKNVASVPLENAPPRNELPAPAKPVPEPVGTMNAPAPVVSPQAPESNLPKSAPSPPAARAVPAVEQPFPEKWRVKWLGSKSKAVYSGVLSINEQLDDDTYSGEMVIRTPQGKEVRQDAVVSVKNSHVEIKCSNPSLAGYPADNFFLTRSGNTMQGYDKDVKGNIGYGVTFTVLKN